MSLTSKGKRWELLHSLWIGWTFTLFLYSIAFFYIGFRARQRKWLMWGTIYAIPLLLFVVIPGPNSPYSVWSNTIGVIWLVLWPVSVFHVFWIRKEYLLRLDSLQRRRGESDVLLKRRLAAEYGEDLRQGGVEQSPTISSQAPILEQTVSEKRRSEKSAPLAEGSPSPDRETQSRSDLSKQAQPERILVPPAKEAIVPPNIMSNDELEYRISSSYPFPLAFGFRALASIVDPRDLYREQLRVAENILAYLGSVSLAILLPQDFTQAKVDPKHYWLTGVSPGDWKEMVAESSKVFADYEDNSLALSIKSLGIRSEKKQQSFGANVAALIKAKNDYKHDRGPVVLEDIADASREVQGRLKLCMEALEFSTNYPIRQVEDFDVARRGGGVILKCLRYTGDHPSFPQEEIPYERALPRGDLFLDQGQHGWTPLFPFMTTMTCSHCKARETYFIDAWDTKRGVARMKSFERGHTTISSEVSEALAEYSNSVRSSET